jgi:hypothetical protein
VRVQRSVPDGDNSFSEAGHQGCPPVGLDPESIPPTAGVPLAGRVVDNLKKFRRFRIFL